VTVSDLGEHDLIARIRERAGAGASPSWLYVGIGDDAAVIEPARGEMDVIATDIQVEHVHFDRSWNSMREIGAKALAVNLSDLAAMGATPIAMLVAMSIPDGWRTSVGEIAEGIGEASRVFNAPITGGNLTSGTELALTVTVLGHSPHPVRRDAVSVGDSVYVTGTLGGPRCAIAAWESGRDPRPEHRARFVRPTARIAEAKWLADQGAIAAIDVSDGLISDLRHVAAASAVDICVELDAIPTISGASVHDAAQSGEEYEVVVAARRSIDGHAFAAAFGTPLTRIGVATAPASGAPDVRLRSHGKFVDLHAGHDHFSR